MGDWLNYLRGLSLGVSTGTTILLVLGLAGAIASLAFFSRRSRLMLQQWLRILLVASTGVSLLLGVLAYAQLSHTKKEKQLAVMFLADGSASIPDGEWDRARDWIRQAEQSGGDTWTRRLIFAGDPRLLSPEQAKNDDAFRRPDDPYGTNIARALQHSFDLFPENCTRRAILLTDGNQTEGDLLTAATQAAAHGIELDAVVLDTRTDRDLYVESISVPAAARPGERVKVGVAVVTNYATAAKLTIILGGKTILNQTVNVEPGRNNFSAEAAVGEQAAATASARLDAPDDLHPENNAMSASLRIAARPKVAFFSSRLDADLPLVEALDGSRIQVQPASSEQLPSQPGALYPYDVVVLADPNYQTMTAAQQGALLQYVKEGGGGVLVIGGENTGELGKKDNRAPIKKMMPVEFKEKKKTEPNPVTLVLVIDKSASMARQRKFSMAVQAANETINELDERSRIGVILFDDYPRWAIPLQKVGKEDNKKKMEEELKTYGVDGGTSIYPAISEAYKLLKDDTAKVKHIILLSDGISLTTFQQWGHLVEWMGSKKITISSVALGSESDQEHLKKIASVGKGRYYYTEDFSQIPRIFLEEAKQITKTGTVEKKFKPAVLKKGDLLEGIDAAALPELTGYNPAATKPTSEVYLTADREEPLLARWRYGLGRVTALATDTGGKWAADWRTWPGYGNLMARLVRGTLADMALRNYRIEAVTADRQAATRIDVTDQFGNFVNDLDLALKITGPDGTPQEATLKQTQPGGYEGRFPVPEYGAYSLLVEPRGGGLQRSQGVGQVNLAPPPEFVAVQPDRALLTRAVAIGGGKLNPAPAEVFAAPEVEYPRREPLWQYMLYAALASMLLSLLIRRGLFGG
ncbi:MAG: VWA domain-containing protein [Myxococcales bacterium]|nr:VWA domain-containing protein [Myxococcales bacterium]